MLPGRHLSLSQYRGPPANASAARPSASRRPALPKHQRIAVAVRWGSGLSVEPKLAPRLWPFSSRVLRTLVWCRPPGLQRRAKPAHVERKLDFREFRTDEFLRPCFRPPPRHSRKGQLEHLRCRPNRPAVGKQPKSMRYRTQSASLHVRRATQFAMVWSRDCTTQGSKENL